MNIKVLMDVYGPLFGLKNNLEIIADGVGPDSHDLVYLALKGVIAHVDQMMEAIQKGAVEA